MPVTQIVHFDAELPVRGEAPNTFTTKANAAWVELKNVTVTQMNTAFGQLNTLETNVNSKEATATSNASISAQKANEATSKASEAGGYSALTLQKYNELVTLINSLVLPTEATYNSDTIDSKIADGVLLYGLMYGFGESKVVKGDAQIAAELFDSHFLLNYTQGK